MDGSNYTPTKLVLIARLLRRIPAIFWATIMLAAITGCFTAMRMSEIGAIRKPFKAAIYENGYIDKLRPTDSSYGYANTGMFGMLPDYLEAAGGTIQYIQSNISDATLVGTDLLIVINPQHTWSPDELRSVWGWIKKGGGLLVLGDHTDLLGTQSSLNSLLQPARITFNFDAAYPYLSDWKCCLAYAVHPALGPGLDNVKLQVAIGASLHISKPAFPLVVGKYGFSDHGDRTNIKGAFLGDYKFQTNERMGNVVLVAGANYGKGRLIVFGDTTSYQNLALPWSNDTVVSRTIGWMLKSSSSGEWKDFAFILGGTSAISILIFLICVTKISIFPVVACLVLSFYSMRLTRTAFNEAGNHLLKMDQQRKYAFIETKNDANFSSEHSRGRSIDGLITTTMRSGFLPYVVNEFAGNQYRGNILVEIAPQRTLNRQDTNRVCAFAANGGHVVIFAGYQDSKMISGVLTALDLQVKEVPLGFASDRLFAEENKKSPLFNDAWLISSSTEYHESNVSHSIIYSFNQAPVVVMSVLGKGYVTLVSDSGFPLNQNLEYVYTFDRSNVEFTEKILGYAKEEDNRSRE